MPGQTARLSGSILVPLDVDSKVFSGNMENYPTKLLSLAFCSSASDTSGLRLRGLEFHNPRPVKVFQEGLRDDATCSQPAKTLQPPSVRSAASRSQAQGLPGGEQREERPRKPARAAAAPIDQALPLPA